VIAYYFQWEEAIFSHLMDRINSIPLV